jgi:hypothetical protein
MGQSFKALDMDSNESPLKLNGFSVKWRIYQPAGQFGRIYKCSAIMVAASAALETRRPLPQN